MFCYALHVQCCAMVCMFSVVLWSSCLVLYCGLQGQCFAMICMFIVVLCSACSVLCYDLHVQSCAIVCREVTQLHINNGNDGCYQFCDMEICGKIAISIFGQDRDLVFQMLCKCFGKFINKLHIWKRKEKKARSCVSDQFWATFGFLW